MDSLALASSNRDHVRRLLLGTLLPLVLFFLSPSLSVHSAIDVGLIATTTPTTVVFQEGVAGYLGTVDTYIMEGSPNSEHGASGSVEWDGEGPSGSSQDKIALVRFDSIFGPGLGQVPLGATITSATLTYLVDSKGHPADVHEVLVDWSEGATYNDFGGDPGVQPDEYGDLVEAASAFVSIGVHSVDVIASLSAWTNAPSQNRGWIFLPTGSDGVDFRSSEYSTIAPSASTDPPKAVVPSVALYQNPIAG